MFQGNLSLTRKNFTGRGRERFTELGVRVGVGVAVGLDSTNTKLNNKQAAQQLLSTGLSTTGKTKGTPGTQQHHS